MNDRLLSDAQISAALRAHLPAQAQPGLPGRVMDAVEITPQRRPLPSFLGALGDADPVTARRSLLIAATLLLGLVLASAAAIGGLRLLLQRDSHPDLDLTPPRDVSAFVLSSYDQMPKMLPVAITTLTNGSVKGRMYVDRSGAVRFEHYATPDAAVPDSYEILNGTTMGELAMVQSTHEWIERDGAISEDPRVFLLAEMLGGAAASSSGCGVTRNEGEVGDGTAASHWTFVGTEDVVGRPTFHFACGGVELWIDVETRLVLRSQGPGLVTEFPVDGQQVPGSSGATTTIEVTDLQFGDQPADLFRISQPPGVAETSDQAFQCQIYPAACPSLSPPQPAYSPPAKAIEGPEPSLPPSHVTNGSIAVSANPWTFGGGQNGDIYLLNEGTTPRRIIGSDGDGIAQACPAFSPDGHQLAYGESKASGTVTTYRGNWPVDERAIVVVDIDEHGIPSAAPMRFALPAGLGPMVCPEWSPTGRSVAFRDGTNLWIGDVASGETRIVPITSVTGQEVNELAWSRDGSRIAVAEPGDIRIVHVDGGAATLIPVEGAAPRSLGWSADDAHLVYVDVAPVDENGSAIHIVGVDGTNDTQLSGHGPAGAGAAFSVDEATVSPDGTRVAYLQSSSQCSTDGCTSGPTVAPIVVMDLYDANRVEMSGPALPQGSDGSAFFASGLAWSPDGKRLLLSSIDGVVSVGLGSGSPPVVYSVGMSPSGLNLEWSYPQVSWQSMLK